MKIAVFHNLPPGGAKRVFFEQLKSLSQKHSIDLFEYTSTDEKYLDARVFARKTFRFPFSIQSSFPVFLSRLHRDFQNFVTLQLINKKIAERINTEGYNIVLVHADRFTQAPFILKFLRIPSLYFCQEYLRMVYEKELKFNENVFLLNKLYEKITRAIRKEIDRENARDATTILVNSNFTWKNIEKAYGVKAQTDLLGVDTQVFKPTGGIKKNYILFVARKSRINGFGLAQKAVELAAGKNKEVELRVLGGSDGFRVKEGRELAKLYSEAFVTICTSYNEPFGLVPLESMACATPVLAVNEGGYRETVVDGKTGFLLPRNPRAFAEKVVFLLRNKKTYREMSLAASEHVKKSFGWEKHMEILERELVKIAAK